MLDWRRKLFLCQVSPDKIDVSKLSSKEMVYYTKHNVFLSVETIATVLDKKLDDKWETRHKAMGVEAVVEEPKVKKTITSERLKNKIKTVDNGKRKTK